MTIQDKIFRPDGWSATARLGLVVPHADVGPEAECAALGGSQVSVHGARINFSAMRAGGEMDPKIPHDPVESFTQPPYIDDIAASLCESPLTALGLAFTSSAYKHGPEGERALVERLRPRLRGIPVVTTCLAAETALRSLGIKRLAIVNPAWFDEDLDALGARYFEAAGFDVVHHAPCGLKSGQKYVSPPALYDWIKTTVAPSGADAVFVGGNGQRAIGVIDAVESQLGLKMLTANQVLFWGALQAAGVQPSVEGYGTLFSKNVTPV
ncbi:hypothetical protein K3553_01575 [Leisingera aquaemixtae]|uniref:maleate cis-trans isomerase family protein n=1 Tax=Leisingera aquaemixtae TaxID=1396826 RepID=UPI0021A2B93A|nr:hypothetical protein [Leisingera aquaemixtae]UWQ25180.1 hypothetical protein K3553_01575 [Leisingera aquaemixtae]UWQ37707.1 hypothetical protein K3552_01490 [Leisingera aquaemixtae]